MRERLAQALFESSGRKGTPPRQVNWQATLRDYPETAAYWFGQVDAILDELAEPTGGMVRKGFEAGGTNDPNIDLVRIWQAMLRAVKTE